MSSLLQKNIYTIGHSTRSLEEFISILNSFEIKLLADIRSYPGSKRFPHFNKEALQISLLAHDILYKHFPNLGGRKKALKNSKNTGWKNDSFRGYADYIESNDFKEAIEKVQDAALDKCTAYMCSEAVWWRCHRSIVSDYLKLNNWKVMHIMSANKAEEHPYTSVAKIVNGQLNYSDKSQQKLF